MSEPDQSNCLNCGSKTNGAFCSACGQSTTVHRITLRETINDFFSSTFALEGPLLSTIKGLIINPGRLFREFINGKRKTYYKPVAFFVVLTAAYLILREAINYDPFEDQPQMKSENIPERAKLFIMAGRFMVANINNIMFFLVLSIGLMQKLFFYRKYYLAEYIVTGFFISGIYLLFGMLHMLFSVSVVYITPRLNLIILFFYLVYSMVSFHQKTTVLNILKYVTSALLSIALYVVLGYGFSLLITYFNLT